jgi:hypothetical protein
MVSNYCICSISLSASHVIKLIAHCYPAFPQIILSAEELQVLPIWPEGLTDVIDFLRLLRVPGPSSFDNIFYFLERLAAMKISFQEHKASFGGMPANKSTICLKRPEGRLFDPRDCFYVPIRV